MTILDRLNAAKPLPADRPMLNWALDRDILDQAARPGLVREVLKQVFRLTHTVPIRTGQSADHMATLLDLSAVLEVDLCLVTIPYDNVHPVESPPGKKPKEKDATIWDQTAGDEIDAERTLLLTIWAQLDAFNRAIPDNPDPEGPPPFRPRIRWAMVNDELYFYPYHPEPDRGSMFAPTVFYNQHLQAKLDIMYGVIKQVFPDLMFTRFRSAEANTGPGFGHADARNVRLYHPWSRERTEETWRKQTNEIQHHTGGSNPGGIISLGAWSNRAGDWENHPSDPWKSWYHMGRVCRSINAQWWANYPSPLEQATVPPGGDAVEDCQWLHSLADFLMGWHGD